MPLASVTYLVSTPVPIDAQGPTMPLVLARPTMLLVTLPAPGRLREVPADRVKVPVASASVWPLATSQACPPPSVRFEVIDSPFVAAVMSIPPVPSVSVLPPSDTAPPGLVSCRPLTAWEATRLIERLDVEEAPQSAVSPASGTPMFQLPTVPKT